MLRGIFALFFRSLRGDSRSLWVHMSWLFLLTVIYVALWFAQEQSRFVGAPGLEFFRYVIYLNAIFVTLLGTSYFSSVIAEEKEEDTLGLMTMAGISPLGILLGKSTTRLFQVFLLLALQYPFTLLAITLGGLMPDQIYAAYMALLTYTMLLANAGLLCSVISRRSRDAAGLTTLMVIAYCVVPIFAFIGWQCLTSPTGILDPESYWLKWAPTLIPILRWISNTSVFGQLYHVTETGYQFQWTPQLISNALGGILFFLMSWWLFLYVSHDPAPEATTRGMVPKKTGRMRLFSAGRTWDVALAWKDFHFIAGGWVGFVTRCFLYTGVYWLAFAASYPWYYRQYSQDIRWADVTYGFQVFLPPLFAVDCALCASRVFQEEIRNQTLASLLMLPRSIYDICYTKLAGCVVGLIPGVVALIIGYFCLQDSNQIFRQHQVLYFAMWYTANLFLAVHLSLLFSLYFRWGALAMAFACTFGSMFVSVLAIELLFVRTTMNSHQLMLGMCSIPLFLACLGCHMVLLLRVPALGEK